MNQTCSNVEYLFVDDGSTDDSMRIVKSVVEEFPCRKSTVRYFQHTCNQGLAKARATAIDNATGDWIAHVDADDWIAQDYFAKVLEVADSTTADVIFTTLVRVGQNGKKSCCCLPSFRGGRDFVSAIGLTEGMNSMVNKVYRHDVLKGAEIEILCNGSLGEDLAYTAQAVSLCDQIAYCPEAKYFYRSNETSITGSQDGEAVVSSLMSVYEILCRQLPQIEYDNMRDRLLRDILLKAIKHGTETPQSYATKRNMLKAPLCEDSRLSLTKKTVLLLADASYPVTSGIVGAARRFFSL